MVSLAHLLNSPEGIAFLESKGVYVSLPDFCQQLRPPFKKDLINLLGSEKELLAWDGQQLYIDYRRSVLSKIQALHDLEDRFGVLTAFIWVDTDRSGSDKAITKFILPVAGKAQTISIADSRTAEVEIRFVNLDPSTLKTAIGTVKTYLPHFPEKKGVVRPRYEQLQALFLREEAISLAEFNRQLTYFLLQTHLGLNPRPLILSEMLKTGLLTSVIEEFINHLPAVVKVFNGAVEALVKQDIDPQVKPLPENYFPLRYSCDGDNTRLRLQHQVDDGGDHFAAATCRCGKAYRFFLGNRTLSLSEITGTDRWSPDVCLPIFLNDFVSGQVAGKSSALYGLVLNAVLEEVLARRPIPILVPASLGKENEPGHVDSLIYNYLNGFAGL